MCIESFFGIPLKKAVYGLGFFKLILTLVFAIISLVEQSQEVCKDEETKKPIQCVGPLVQKVFFDLLFPLACALCLIYGAKRGSRCLLISWFCIVFVSYIQYLYVFFASDWSEADDWVAICYVVYYTTASIVVFSYMKVANRTEGVVHGNIIKNEQGQAAAAQATTLAGTTVTIQQQQPAAAYPQQQQQQFQQQAPYDPNMAVYTAQPAGYNPNMGAGYPAGQQPAPYVAPQPGYPGAPPAYTAQAPYPPQDPALPPKY